MTQAEGFRESDDRMATVPWLLRQWPIVLSGVTLAIWVVPIGEAKDRIAAPWGMATALAISVVQVALVRSTVLWLLPLVLLWKCVVGLYVPTAPNLGDGWRWVATDGLFLLLLLAKWVAKAEFHGVLKHVGSRFAAWINVEEQFVLGGNESPIATTADWLSSFHPEIHSAPALSNILVSREFANERTALHSVATTAALGVGTVIAESARAVDCTIFAPERVQPGQTSLLQVFLHAPQEKASAHAAALRFDDSATEHGYRSLVLDAHRGDAFTFVVSIDGVTLRNPINSLVWNDVPQAATFLFEVPRRCRAGSRAGTVQISKDGIPVGRIDFHLEVARKAQPARHRPIGTFVRRYRNCFCSYSSRDRVEMLKRAQGLKAAGLQVFVDVLDLRGGDKWNPEILAAIDRSDLFVVIWSASARESRWVQKEIRHALDRFNEEGAPDFRAIPIEGPPIAPVPRRLCEYHFNDAMLYSLRAAELETTGVQGVERRRTGGKA